MPHRDPRAATSPRLRLRAGVRVSRRGDGHLQVGLHPTERVVLPDTDDVRRLLRDLGHGVRGAASVPDPVGVLDTLHERGLLEASDEAEVRRRLLGSARVGVVSHDAGLRATALRVLGSAGLQVAERAARATVVLHVTTGAEPRRETMDRWMREDRPHLPLTALAGRTRLGPLVVPGLTACVRCVDEHLTDRDPRHPLVLEQHLTPDPRDAAHPHQLQLALAWAVRDLACWVQGQHPVTWSATVELDAGPPRVEDWARHPRCGCAWGDALAG